MLTSKQRAFLRGIANDTPAIFQVGKYGVTPELTDSVDNALEARELVKISVLGSCMESVSHIADVLHERTHSEIVQVIGKKIVLYRPTNKENKSKNSISYQIKKVDKG